MQDPCSFGLHEPHCRSYKREEEDKKRREVAERHGTDHNNQQRNPDEEEIAVVAESFESGLASTQELFLLFLRDGVLSSDFENTGKIGRASCRERVSQLV